MRPLRKRGASPTTPAEHLRALGTEPVSRHFGADRGAGKPVDRWWIERFLAAHRADVRGRVLEIAESTYTQWYGDGEVTRSDVLFAAAGHPDATVIGNLVTGEGMPPAAFDCFLCTQTLHVIDDVAAAVRGIHDTLAPGGVALVTMPAVSQTSREDARDWGDWWRFTSTSATRLFADAFGAGQIQVRAHGNVMTACAFLYGLSAEELTDEELAYDDPEYEALITVRAVRAVT